MAEIPIEDFRGALPCDLISIIQVVDKRTGIAMRAMTDTFLPPEHHVHPTKCKDLINNVHPAPLGMDRCPCHPHHHNHEASFKTQGRIIYTSFPHGMIEMAYKSIPVDDEGYPLLIEQEATANSPADWVLTKSYMQQFSFLETVVPTYRLFDFICYHSKSVMNL